MDGFLFDSEAFYRQENLFNRRTRMNETRRGKIGGADGATFQSVP